MKIKILNGLVVSAEETYKADIGIEDGVITHIERKARTATADMLPMFEADSEIDAAHHYVLPGGVDAHTHFDMPFGGTVTADDFYTGTVAAACGGTTTIIDFAIQNKGESLKQALDKWKQKAANKAVIDYSFHIAITDLTDDILAEIPQMLDEGVTSFKLFMAYKGNLMSADKAIAKVLAQSGKLGFLTMLHCEDGDAIDESVKDFLAHKQTGPLYHALSRPPELEEAAIARAVKMATNGNLYVVHLSTEAGLKHIKKARADKLSVYTETCPQYLVLSIEKYTEKPHHKRYPVPKDVSPLPEEFEGAKYVMSPPLRGKHNNSALWQGIADGAISVVSTDHCAFNYYGGKSLGKDDFSKIPNGAPGVETRLLLLYSEGVAGKRITINNLVEVFATAPAKLFGLYPRKGEIKIGSDADMVIFNPERKFEIEQIKLHQNVDYCPYEGYKGTGAIMSVLYNGRVIYKDKGFCGTKGQGRFIKRDKFRSSIVQ